MSIGSLGCLEGFREWIRISPEEFPRVTYPARWVARSPGRKWYNCKFLWGRVRSLEKENS